MKEKTVLDLPSPLFKNNGCPQPLQCFDGGNTFGAAVKSVAMITDPCGFGVRDIPFIDVILRINRPTYKQPGPALAKMNPLYNHLFASFVAATMGGGTEVYADDDFGFKNNLNIFFGDNKPGVYDIFTDKCWKFFCYSNEL